MHRARRAARLTLVAATLSVAGGCEVVAIVSAVEDDGYPPPPVYLPQCPYSLSQSSEQSDRGGVFHQLTLSPQGLPVNPLIATDEDVSLLFTSITAEPRDSVAGARATGSMRVDDTWTCLLEWERAVVVELDTSGTGACVVEASVGIVSMGSFELEVAEPRSFAISFQDGSRYRGTLLDEQGRELFADASIEWEATPNGFLPGTETRGMFAPPISGTAPEITLLAYRGSLTASIRLRNENGFYVPAE